MKGKCDKRKKRNLEWEEILFELAKITQQKKGRIGVNNRIVSVNTFLLKNIREKRNTFYCVTEERSINVYLLCLSQEAEVPEKKEKKV